MCQQLESSFLLESKFNFIDGTTDFNFGLESVRTKNFTEATRRKLMTKCSPIISKISRYGFLASAAVLALNQNAFAAGSGMPWEGPLDQILNSLAGPVARAIGVAAIVVTGLGIAFGEGGGGMRKMLWVVFGLTIAFSATSFFLSFFGGASGASF